MPVEATAEQTVRRELRPSTVVFRVLIAMALVALVGWWVWPEPEPPPSGIDQVFRLDEAEFHLLDQGIPTDPARLNGGVYYPSGIDGPYMRATGEPTYADLDGDDDWDAAAVLEWTDPADESRSWRAVYFWLWDDGEVVTVKWPAAWLWNCVNAGFSDEREFGPSNRVAPAGVMVERFEANTCDDERTEPVRSRPVPVAVEDGVPVVKYTADFTTATEMCPGGMPAADRTGLELVDITGVTPALVQPVPGAAEVEGVLEDLGEFTVEIAVGDPPTAEYLELHNGYVTALVDWDGLTGCGWVEWEAVAFAFE
ncbi:hypothetical protein LX16_4211 [Stackebrandtia albiflava]|uniref:Uncharacterized protein n=1 Tax=Stackebrandtia albiflava TaxID=406432 RepID=A0A562UYW3_9ACTN|nr:hypothetical protein [Stackebrandtia albiflava]TWJ10787.1 hypothetical protein LX16_4211 [Stackebrandtia albiflava]